jgi:transcriptional regulator with XRE-family HTH domain
MAGDAPRRCRRCLALLARDNESTLCGACSCTQREGVAGEDVPSAFWGDDGILAAVADRHFGRLVKAYRHHPHHGRRPLSQELAASRLGLSQAQLSRIENGPAPQNIDRLLAWATRLKVPPRLLWFVARAIGLVRHPPGASELDRAWARGLVVRHARDSRLRLLDVLELGDDSVGDHAVLQRLAQVSLTRDVTVLLTHGVESNVADRLAGEVHLNHGAVITSVRPSAST